jgi:DNA topoisomerase-1
MPRDVAWHAWCETLPTEEVLVVAKSSEAARLLADAEASARISGLRYIDQDELEDEHRGHRRVLCRGRFRYLDADGQEIRDADILDRCASLKIPPGWTDVWVCADPRGHIQATGRDARGRKQYRYHPEWRAVRDATKFEKVLDFARALPALRARVEADLGRTGLDRQKVLATAVRLLDTTLIRIGNEEYTRTNGSYGLTTLRRKHVKIDGNELVFQFRGKSGKDRRVSVRDPRLARVIRRCQELPGQVLLKYVDESGEARCISSEDVNAYLREATGDDFTAKDFRTWAATVLAGLALQEIAGGESPPVSVEKQIVAAVKAVSETLGNTPSVCRKCYVHPVVLDAHKEGALLAAMARRLRRVAPSTAGLRPEEAAVLAFLASRLKRARAAARPATAMRATTRPASRRAVA